jgi:hypothetical protein
MYAIGCAREAAPGPRRWPPNAMSSPPSIKQWLNPTSRIEDGDEIAFFPPVTGG